MLDNLYLDIGEKIKRLAQLIFIIEAIGAVIAGIALLIDAFILAGLLTLFLGPIVAFISTWAVYAFGQLVDDTRAIRMREKTINNIDKNLQIMAQPIIDEANEKAKRNSEKKIQQRAEHSVVQPAPKNLTVEVPPISKQEVSAPREKTLTEKMEFALTYKTDIGMINYLKTSGAADREIVRDILNGPPDTIRERIEHAVNNL